MLGSGFLFTAQYWLQAALSLQQFYAADQIPIKMSTAVSLTRSGLPRIIPPFHRKMIRRKDERADKLVKLYLSLLSVHKVIPFAPKVSVKTFESITTPLTLRKELFTYVDDFVANVPKLLSSIGMSLRFGLFPLNRGLDSYRLGSQSQMTLCS